MKDFETQGKFQRRRCIIYPYDKFKHVWDNYMTLILLLICIYEPLAVAFRRDNTRPVWEIVIDSIVWFSIALEVIINFNAAFYDKETNVIDRRKVSPYSNDRLKENFSALPENLADHWYDNADPLWIIWSRFEALEVTHASKNSKVNRSLPLLSYYQTAILLEEE